MTRETLGKRVFDRRAYGEISLDNSSRLMYDENLHPGASRNRSSDRKRKAKEEWVKKVREVEVTGTVLSVGQDPKNRLIKGLLTGLFVYDGRRRRRRRHHNHHHHQHQHHHRHRHRHHHHPRHHPHRRYNNFSNFRGPRDYNSLGGGIIVPNRHRHYRRRLGRLRRRCRYVVVVDVEDVGDSSSSSSSSGGGDVGGSGLRSWNPEGGLCPHKWLPGSAVAHLPLIPTPSLTTEEHKAVVSSRLHVKGCSKWSVEKLHLPCNGLAAIGKSSRLHRFSSYREPRKDMASQRCHYFA
uniref:Uncharacterized protein n=1 Tax=Vespula pensylvanica TaxID=30213 RepID=A0A834U7X2_VESPE|nr:hypothetical protein H0235_010647 [Vespula pensylvanica]